MWRGYPQVSPLALLLKIEIAPFLNVFLDSPLSEIAIEPYFSSRSDVVRVYSRRMFRERQIFVADISESHPEGDWPSLSRNNESHIGRPTLGFSIINHGTNTQS